MKTPEMTDLENSTTTSPEKKSTTTVSSTTPSTICSSRSCSPCIDSWNFRAIPGGVPYHAPARIIKELFLLSKETRPVYLLAVPFFQQSSAFSIAFSFIGLRALTGFLYRKAELENIWRINFIINQLYPNLYRNSLPSLDDVEQKASTDHTTLALQQSLLNNGQQTDSSNRLFDQGITILALLDELKDANLAGTLLVPDVNQHWALCMIAGLMQLWAWSSGILYKPVIYWKTHQDNDTGFPRWLQYLEHATFISFFTLFSLKLAMNRLARLKRMTQVRTHCMRDIIEDYFIDRIQHSDDTASVAYLNDQYDDIHQLIQAHKTQFNQRHYWLTNRNTAQVHFPEPHLTRSDSLAHSDSLRSADDHHLGLDELKTLIINQYHHNVCDRALLQLRHKARRDLQEQTKENKSTLKLTIRTLTQTSENNNTDIDINTDSPGCLTRCGRAFGLQSCLESYVTPTGNRFNHYFNTLHLLSFIGEYVFAVYNLTRILKLNGYFSQSAAVATDLMVAGLASLIEYSIHHSAHAMLKPIIEDYTTSLQHHKPIPGQTQRIIKDALHVKKLYSPLSCLPKSRYALCNQNKQGLNGFVSVCFAIIIDIFQMVSNCYHVIAPFLNYYLYNLADCIINTPIEPHPNTNSTQNVTAFFQQASPSPGAVENPYHNITSTCMQYSNNNVKTWAVGLFTLIEGAQHIMYPIITLHANQLIRLMDHKTAFEQQLKPIKRLGSPH